jgi:hypothetical protein
VFIVCWRGVAVSSCFEGVSPSPFVDGAIFGQESWAKAGATTQRRAPGWPLPAKPSRLARTGLKECQLVGSIEVDNLEKRCVVSRPRPLGPSSRPRLGIGSIAPKPRMAIRKRIYRRSIIRVESFLCIRSRACFGWNCRSRGRTCKIMDEASEGTGKSEQNPPAKRAQRAQRARRAQRAERNTTAGTGRPSWVVVARMSRDSGHVETRSTVSVPGSDMSSRQRTRSLQCGACTMLVQSSGRNQSRGIRTWQYLS